MKLNQLETPALYIDLDAFDRNQNKLVQFLKERNLKFRPHYKSTKCTALAHKQIDSGACGISCAKTDEAYDLIHSGIDNVLIANEVIDSDKISRVATLANCCYLTICVDTLENIEDLSKAAKCQNSTIHCLVDLNVGANRCGVNTKEEVLELAQKIMDSENLVYDGIQAYAGQISHQHDYSVRKNVEAEVEIQIKETVKFLEKNGIDSEIISGVSTGSVFLKKEDTVFTEVQVGSYSYMDASYGKLNLDFENALYVLGTVMRITDSIVILDTGRKSVSVDQSMPIVKDYPDYELKVSEEHIRFSKENVEAKIGDKMPIVPGHCCTTMNLYDYIYFVRGDKIVDRVQITSRGRSK